MGRNANDNAKAAGFTLIEILVAMVLLALSLLGSARLVVTGVELEDRARRLLRAEEAIESAALEGGAAETGCDVQVRPAYAGIRWRWIEALCGEEAGPSGAPPVRRTRLVPG